MKRGGLVLILLAIAAAGAFYYYRSAPQRQGAVAEIRRFQRMSPPGTLEDVRIGFEVRKTVATSVPGELKWEVDVLPGTRLQWAVATDPPADESAPAETWGSFTAAVDIAGKLGYETGVRPGQHWRDLELDLSAYAGRRIAIVFRATLDKRPKGKLRALWGNPTISAPPDTRESRRNYLLISVDALRADHLGCYGYARATSPTIDKLAREGRRYTTVYTSQSSTWPALTSLLTSLQPSTHGVTWNGYQFRKRDVMLPEIFESQGYATSAFLANMGRGTHRGFDQKYIYKDGVLINKLLRRFAADSDRPFFHWVHFIGPHDSYKPPKPFEEAFGKVKDPTIGHHNRCAQFALDGKHPTPDQLDDILKLYDGEIRAVDEMVARIFATLRQYNLDKNTVIIFTADHGEELFDHFNYSFHSGSMYNTTLHIPLIIWGAPELPKGGTDTTPSSIIDVAPTILQLAGLKAPSSFQGQSLLVPLESRRGAALSETWEEIFSIADASYRYVNNPKLIQPRTEAGGWPYPIAAEELYDVLSDPLQKHNIIAANHGEAEILKARLTQWKQIVAKVPVEKQEIDKQTQDELKALGYVY